MNEVLQYIRHYVSQLKFYFFNKNFEKKYSVKTAR